MSEREHLRPDEVLPPERRRLSEQDRDGEVLDVEIDAPGRGRSRQQGSAPRMRARRRTVVPGWLRWLGVAGLIGAAFWLAMTVSGGGFSVQDTAREVRDAGPWGRIAMVVCIAALVPTVIPTGPFAIVSGYLWGTVEGTVWVVLGASLGGLIAMTMSRAWLARRVEAWLLQRPPMKAVKDALDARGLRIVTALRLSPVVPFGLMSYVAGLSTLPRWQYFIAAFLGGIPWTSVYAVAGSVLAESARALTLDTPELGEGGLLLRYVGLGLTVFVAVWVGRIARAELAGLRAAANAGGGGRG